MHYTQPIPEKLAALLRTELGIAEDAGRPTYGDVLDALAGKYNVHFVFEPFTTFAFEGRTGFVWRISRYDDAAGRHRTISEDGEYEGGAFGGSWELTANDALTRAVKFIKEEK